MSLKDFQEIDKQLDKAIASTESLLTKSYENHIKDIRAYFAELYGDYGVDGKLPYSELSKYNRLTNTQEEIDKIANSLYSEMIVDINRDLQAVYVLTYDSTMGVLEKEAGKIIRGTVQTDAIQKALKTPVAGLTIDLRMEQYEQDIARKLYQQLTIASTQGLSPSQLSKNVGEVFTQNNYNIRRIVETESHRLQETAKLDTMERAEAQGNEVWKKWISARDSRVRASHRQLNGTTIKKDELFHSPTGARGKAPGLMGSAADDINCRCFLQILIKNN